MDSNTCDLRGKRVDEALRATELFFDRMLRSDHRIVYVLHGHGTGALKKAIRQWLPSCSYVCRFRPADSHEGEKPEQHDKRKP